MEKSGLVFSGSYILWVVRKFCCLSHHRDVRPGMNGLHRVVVKTSTTDKGIRHANHFCDEREKVAAFSKDEQVKYTGDMDEKGYENTKRVTTVSKAVGGAAWFFGG
ncbi:MAG: hypothetical protein VX642_11495 [Bdellovibrionota bacterium]|nr:hypothetical protein [Bdellovibrionota bacterium]